MAKFNPFITSGYIGIEYFCNRENETTGILGSLMNGRSITLTSVRRMGKTGLIRHVFTQLPKGYAGIYIDILSTENLNDFLNVFSSAVFNAIPEKSSPGKKILDFIKSLRPVITFDPLTGQPQVTLDVKGGELNRHIDSILRFLELYPQKVIIAIDEFQQITEYPEKNIDAFLRGIIQSLNNVYFIFSGSQQHLMTELFTAPSKPFYQSTGFLKIGKIDISHYSAFVSRHFMAAGKQISAEVILEMLDWTDLHTYYVQLICNRVFALESGKITGKIWREEASKLLQEYEIIFYKYRDLLTGQQWKLLKAIARENQVFQPTSKDFMAKYSLGSPATVLRSLQALLDREMIYSEYGQDGSQFYCVYDVLFRRWMQRY